MPNWCSNNIRAEFKENNEARNFFTNLVNSINGNEERLESKLWDDSMEKAKREDAWFIGGKNAGLLTLLSPLGENSYDYNIEGWGTKWDVPQSEVSASMDLDGNGCTLSFVSAWSPPINAIQIFAERLRNLDRGKIYLKITFDEGGMNFMGYSKLHWADWEFVEETDTIDEVYNRAKAGDKEALEFIEESNWSIEDLEESYELPWIVVDDDNEDDGDDDSGEYAIDTICDKCGDEDCTNTDHFDSHNLPKQFVEEMKEFVEMIHKKIEDKK